MTLISVLLQRLASLFHPSSPGPGSLAQSSLFQLPVDPFFGSAPLESGSIATASIRTQSCL